MEGIDNVGPRVPQMLTHLRIKCSGLDFLRLRYAPHRRSARFCLWFQVAHNPKTRHFADSRLLPVRCAGPAFRLWISENASNAFSVVHTREASNDSNLAVGHTPC